MLKEIYIDNFRCLTNFRIEPEDFQLWLGDNGSGKTSVFDALLYIQCLMRGVNVDDIFNRNSLTAWDGRKDQTFGLTLMIDGESFKYELKVEYSDQDEKARIQKEKLDWKEVTFFLFDGQKAHLFAINKISGLSKEIAAFPADCRRSVMPAITKCDYNTPLFRFREELEKVMLIHPVAQGLNNVSESEPYNLSSHSENFACWYRHLIQDKPSIGYRAKQLLDDVLPGFEQLSFENTGETRKLIVTFRNDGRDYNIGFQDISDGQRQLILLYNVLEALRTGFCSTVLIDGPENFVSMREIQPWTENLNDICDDGNKQAIIISHHPEIVNSMARGSEMWFSRKPGPHVAVKPFPKIDGLSPAEVMARGWEFPIMEL